MTTEELIQAAEAGNLKPIREASDRLYLAISNYFEDHRGDFPDGVSVGNWVGDTEAAILRTYPKRTSQRDRTIAAYRVNLAWADRLGLN